MRHKLLNNSTHKDILSLFTRVGDQRPWKLAAMAWMVCVGISAAAIAQTPPNPNQESSQSKSLTEGLLNDLFGNPADRSNQVAPATPQTPSTTSNQPGMPNQAGGAGLPSSDPVNRNSPSSVQGAAAQIQTNMWLASQNLRNGQLGEDTKRVQTEIVNQLDAWIQSMSSSKQSASTKTSTADDPQQSNNQSSQSQNATGSDPNAGQKPNDGDSKDANRQGAAPDSANQGTDQGQEGGRASETGPQTGKVVELGNVDLSHGVWGHLPQRIRQQMQSSPSIKFLPQYQKLIEEYYRRMSEEQR